MNKVIMISQSIYAFDPRIIRFADALIERNFQVEVICLRDKDRTKFEKINGVNVYGIMKVFPQSKIYTYVYFSILFTIKAFIKCTILTWGKKEPTLIHVHNMPDYLVFSTIFTKLKNFPIILDMHDLTIELFKEKWSEKIFKNLEFLLKFVEKISCNYADHVITVTKECVDRLTSRGINPEKISLIMNSADENIFIYNDTRFKAERGKYFKFLYHGTIAKRFGIHYFLNAMPIILKAVPRVEFHLYGELKDEYAQELEQTVKILGLENHIKFNKPVQYNELNNMINLFDMGVVTYEQTGYMELVLPTKALEFAANGLPFIISPLAAVKSTFVDEAVYYVNPSDTFVLAKSVIDLINDKNKRIQMSKSCYRQFKTISWGKMKSNYLILVEKLINNRIK